jgi:hypothetical protein
MPLDLGLTLQEIDYVIRVKFIIVYRMPHSDTRQLFLNEVQ